MRMINPRKKNRQSRKQCKKSITIFILHSIKKIVNIIIKNFLYDFYDRETIG